ncbi:S-adenosyl-L-methionine-dependent methyltransferase [Gilbertella persicaria]|uniref:S-adenosyl-L-methionine-dependent methyltransferase n=1 Tax=Gilbertella persicaria TaxID=101096 RepID=UPI00221F6756|nr:S-adenosyl-L-methionine-dependent methyltransferase [Gilbertella persicaria]KAI8087760.1 S-adenosyl-L-methionine-dependent methyltransferase [Gilbertella persicaria]
MGNSISNEEKGIRRFSSSSRSRKSSRSYRFTGSSSNSSFSPSASHSDLENKHETILYRLKHKANRSRGHSHTTSSSSSTHHLPRIDQDKPISPDLSNHEMIGKYADSQMTLLNTKYHPLAGIKAHNDSSTTVNSTTTVNTHSFPQQDPKSFSCELLLKELYMSCETSPERRRERDRRHRQHYLLKRIWGSNYKIPLKDPSVIIDWCCGTAVWDVELAFEFPKAQIIGIDYESFTVSSLTNTVKNFSFHNALIHEGQHGFDAFEDNQVDYVMLRDTWLLNCSLAKWTTTFKEIYRILKPGGHIEIYEQDMSFKPIGPYLNTLENWVANFYATIQFDRNTIHNLEGILSDSGYTNVKKESVEVPIGEWPKTEDLKETGYLQKDLTERGFREGKRWICKINQLSEKEFSNTLSAAMEECDQYGTVVSSLYYSAQKPLTVY